jgi:hypothetical protein
VVESYSAKQNWSCPREGAEAGHIMIGYVQYAAVGTTSHETVQTESDEM